MAYLFSHEDQAERERLAAIEAALDPITIECLQKIGVGEGLTPDEVDQLLNDIQSPDLHAILSVHCSAWGQKMSTASILANQAT